MYKKISLLFLLISSHELKPFGLVELCSGLGFAVMLGIGCKQVPTVMAKLGYNKVLSMPINQPMALVRKQYNVAVMKKKIDTIIAAMSARALQLKKSIYGDVVHVNTQASYASVPEQEKNETPSQGSGARFTQAQQNIFAARGLFARVYVNSESEEQKTARSKYNFWQGAFAGSLTTAVALKAVESKRERSANS